MMLGELEHILLSLGESRSRSSRSQELTLATWTFKTDLKVLSLKSVMVMQAWHA